MTFSVHTIQPEVVEIRLPMTPLMITIQTAILDLIQYTVRELRRINPSVWFFVHHLPYFF